MKRKIVIFGTSDIASLAHFYFKTDSMYEVVGFSVDADYRETDTLEGLPMVSFEELPDHFPPEEVAMFVAIGYAQLNKLRARKVAAARQAGYDLVSYVSSKATVLTQHPIGSNCFILEDNTIQPFVQIGDNVTLWSGNHIGHHATLENDVFIASHVVVSGGVRIGERCFVGVNATLRDHITIGSDCLIGAGALVTRDAEPGGVYTSMPATRSRVPSHRIRNL